MNAAFRYGVRALLVCPSLIVLHLLGSAGASSAQSAQSPRPLSLDEALELAAAHSERMAIARAGVDRAGGGERRARSGLFPQLAASASYDRALASEFSGLFDAAGAPPCPPFIADPLAAVEQRLAELERAVDCGATGPPDQAGTGFENLPFGRKNTYRVNLSFSQNLYSGGRIGAQVAIADAARQTADISLRSTLAQLRLDVVSTYYDAALADRLLHIAEESYRQADATLRQVTLGYEAGSQPEFEVLRARVARDNQRPAVIRQRADRDIALLRLRQLIEVPARQPLELTATLDGDALPPPPAFAAAVGGLAEARPPGVVRAPVLESQAALGLRVATADAARAERLPSITLTSSYGQVAYPSGAFPTLGDFRRNWTIGALVQLPVLTGGRLAAEVAIARADVREGEARVKQVRELAELDTQAAYEELRAARAQWEASSGTVQQAQRAHEIAELRYREGVSTQLELSDARLLLAQAAATRAQAARDVQVALARVALLADLPLGTGTPQPGTGTQLPVPGANAAARGGGATVGGSLATQPAPASPVSGPGPRTVSAGAGGMR